MAKSKFFGIDGTVDLGKSIVLRRPPLANSLVLVRASGLNAVVFRRTSLSDMSSRLAGSIGWRDMARAGFFSIRAAVPCFGWLFAGPHCCPFCCISVQVSLQVTWEMRNSVSVKVIQCIQSDPVKHIGSSPIHVYCCDLCAASGG